MKRYKTEIVADNVILLSSPAGAEGGSYGSSASTSYSAPAVSDSAPEEPRVKKSKPKAEEEIAIADIPF